MTVTDGAIQAIQELIVDGQYSPGDRLPVEADLASTLNVSRGTLREAVRALTLAGVLDVRQGDGSYVAHLDPERLFSGLKVQARIAEGPGLIVIFDSRLVLEPRLAALAAERRTDNDLARLGHAVDAMIAAPTLDEFTLADLAFHRALATASGSPLLGEMASCVALTTLRLRSLSTPLAGDYQTATRVDHGKLVTAIGGRHSDEASMTMLTHLQKVERWMQAAAR